MSLEIKTHDVLPEEEQTLLNIMYSFGWTLKSRQRVSNTSSRPTAAFTYSGVTLIHSETEIDEYTSLTFERETNINHYRKIVSLENEFWELLPHMTAKRPLEPPPKLNFQDWVRASKPKVLSFGEKFLAMLSFFLLIGVPAAISNCNSLRQFYAQHGWSVESDEYAVQVLIALAVAFPIALVLTAICNKIRTFLALKNPKSKGYRIAYNLYEQYEFNHKALLEAPQMYDYAQDRVPRIIAESKRLLDEQ